MVGERSFTAKTTRKSLGDGFPAEYALHGFEELVREPSPSPSSRPCSPTEAPDPRDIAVVRLPLTDADGSVLGYELVVDDGRTSPGHRRPPGCCSTRSATSGSSGSPAAIPPG